MARYESKNNEREIWKIMEKKIATPVNKLCEGFPEEFSLFINYTRDLRFDDRPDFGYLRRLLKQIADKEKIEYDNVFDWDIKRQQKQDNKDIKDRDDNIDMGNNDQS